MRKFWIANCIFLFCLVSVYSTGHATSEQILSNFNYDDEGWVAECADLEYVELNGNPGGHITLTDNCPGSTAAYLPPKFLGDLSQFDGGVISFDVRSLYPLNPNGSMGSGFGQIQMNGTPPNNATYTGFRPYPPLISDTEWTTYYVPFTAEAWALSGNWETTIKNVNTIHIVLGDIAFDNFRICQGIISTFDKNDEGWTANGAALTYIPNPNDNKAGGYITLLDNAGDSFIVLPPSKYFGDLTRFKGGMLSYDIKSLSGPLTSVGSGFGRITIRGGGYSAQLDYAPYPPIPSDVKWTAYYAPMNADAWGVTEQVWQSILSNVTYIDIVLDGADDLIAMDNFKILPPLPSNSVDVNTANLWIGLKNAVDKDARFDVKTEFYINEQLIAEGKILCVPGGTLKSSFIKKVIVPIDSVLEGDFNSEDEFYMKVFTRIGTKQNGSQCGNIKSASGLRLYYDSPRYPSNINAQISPESSEDLYLKSFGSDFYLENEPPTGPLQFKNSSAVNFKNGNPWKKIGTWNMTLP